MHYNSITASLFWRGVQDLHRHACSLPPLHRLWEHCTCPKICVGPLLLFLHPQGEERTRPPSMLTQALLLASPTGPAPLHPSEDASPAQTQDLT